MLEPQMRLRPNEPAILAQTVEDETIIINQSTDVYYRLDRVGSLFFSLLDGSHTVEQATNALAKAFDVPAKQVHGDVQQLAQQMLQEKIIVPADGLSSAPGVDGIPKQSYPYESPRLNLYRMSVHTCLRPNEPEIAATVIDGEAIIINVFTGVYYSLDGVGAVIWSLIDAGLRNQQIIERVAELYDVSTQQVREDLEKLTGQLLAERIVWITAEPPQPGTPLIEKPASPYHSPELNIYTDMEDLLALDPPLPTAIDNRATTQDLHIGDVDWAKPN